MHLLDTSAWIEYLIGSAKGRKVQRILEGNAKALVADPSFAEIYCWCLRTGNDVGTAFTVIRQHAAVVEINTNLWVEGAHERELARKTKPDFSLIDGLLLAAQKRENAKIVTCEGHFRGKKGVLLL